MIFEEMTNYRKCVQNDTRDYPYDKSKGLRNETFQNAEYKWTNYKI